MSVTSRKLTMVVALLAMVWGLRRVLRIWMSRALGNTVRLSLFIPALAPPPPKIGGRKPKTRVISPQNWGVRGGKCNVFASYPNSIGALGSFLTPGVRVVFIRS